MPDVTITEMTVSLAGRIFRLHAEDRSEGPGALAPWVVASVEERVNGEWLSWGSNAIQYPSAQSALLGNIGDIIAQVEVDME